ncbi:Cytochrome P450 [Neofusicoccum parvum]|nr:Cytochrome P450 [Neofusicoccum parvum]
MALFDILATVPSHYLAVSLIGAVASFFFLRSIFRAVFTPLQSIPGPFLARFTRLWYLYRVWKGDFEKVNIELHRKYGPIVRITPYEYSIDDPSAIRPIYGHGTHFVKGYWYTGSSNPDFHTEDIFSGRDPKLHAVNRRKFSSLYSMSALLKMEQPVNECIEIFEQRLREMASSGREMDLQWWMQCYAFDVIAAVSVAKRFGFLDAGEDGLELISTLDGFLWYAAHVGVYSEFHRTIFRISQRLGKHGLAKTMEFTIKQVTERLNDNKDPEKRVEGQDFLAKLLRLHEEEPRNVQMADVLGVIQGNIGAGSDTTSITLTSIFWNVFRNPRVLEKLRAEIDEKYAAGELSDPVTFAEAQKLPYLQAVLQEGLRMHPATGLPMWRAVPKGGAELAGRYFPEGATVGINSWVAHANKQVFGHDADEFVPERWLESKEKSQAMERYFLAFGHGSRTCIGKNISLMEISKLVPTLLRKFDFSLVAPDADLECSNRWFVKQKNIKLIVKERNV